MLLLACPGRKARPMLTKKWLVCPRFNIECEIANQLFVCQVMPGDNVEMVCELVHDIAAEVGTRFTLREGGKTGKCLRPS